MSLCGRLDEASAKVRGVPPSTVDARMKNPVSPEAMEMCALSILEGMPLPPPGILGGYKSMIPTKRRLWTSDGGYLSAALAENDYGGAQLQVEKLGGNGAASWTSTQRLDEYSSVVALIPTTDGGSAVLGMYMKY